MKLAPAKRGYDHRWAKLSHQARQLQPFCTDCGRTDTLTLDHSPSAWTKVAAGKALTMRDAYNGLLIVRCQACNNKAGPARGYRVTRTS